MHAVKAIFIILICTLLLSACGNKGPLYLPGEKTAVEKTSPTEAEKDDEEKENSAPG